MINLFMLCCACGFSACAGLSALQEDNHQEFKQEQKVEFKQDNKRLVSYNDETYEITLSISEAQNYVWYNFSQYFIGEHHSAQNFTMSDYIAWFEYNGETLDNFNYVAVNTNYFVFDLIGEGVDPYISFNDQTLNNKFLLLDENDASLEFQFSLIIGCTTEKYNEIKEVIEFDIQANTTGQEDYQNALGQFVQILVGGIQSLATGVASGIVGMASALFLETDNGSVTGLSVFGGIVAIFAGLALAIALTTKVYTWVTSLGN